MKPKTDSKQSSHKSQTMEGLDLMMSSKESRKMAAEWRELKESSEAPSEKKRRKFNSIVEPEIDAIAQTDNDIYFEKNEPPSSRQKHDESILSLINEE